MKTTLIRLEPQDDYISVRDKLSWVKNGRALLIWPRRGGPVFRLLDWQMIRHTARRQGIQLAVVARQGRVKRDAARAGLPVFARLAEAQRAPWPRWQPLPRRPRADLQAWRAALRAKTPPLPLPVRLALFALAWLAVLMLGGVVFLPSAQVRLTFSARRAQVRLPLTSLPRSTMQVVAEGTEIVPATGQVKAPVAAARGQVALTNVAAVPLDVPRGTVLYALTDPPVACETLQFHRLDVGETALVGVAALEAGEAGNLPAEVEWMATGPLGAALQIHNPQPLTGGASTPAKGPSAADRALAQRALREALRQQALEALNDQLSTGDALLSDTLRVAETFEQFFLPEDGQPGEQGVAYARQAFAADYVRAEDLQQAVRRAYLPPEGFQPQWESMTATIEGDAVLVAFPLLPAFSEGRLFQLVRGRRPAQAAARLQASLPLAYAPIIELRPAAWPWLPLLPYQLEFIQDVE